MTDRDREYDVNQARGFFYYNVCPEDGVPEGSGDFAKALVLGGSTNSTTGPVFAAEGALAMGASEAHILTRPSAVSSMQRMNPDARVSGSMPEAGKNLHKGPSRLSKNTLKAIKESDVVIAGNGLGTQSEALSWAYEVLCTARQVPIPQIVNGDGLQCLTRLPNAQFRDFVGNNEYLIICVDHDEWLALIERMGKGTRARGYQFPSWCETGPILVLTGSVDRIMAPNRFSHHLICEMVGVNDPTAGQGNILAGAIGMAAIWADWSWDNLPDEDGDGDDEYEDDWPGSPRSLQYRLMASALYACSIMRNAAWSAYEESEQLPDLWHIANSLSSAHAQVNADIGQAGYDCSD